MIRINLFKPEKKDIIITPALEMPGQAPDVEKPRRSSTPSLIMLLAVVAVAAAALTQQQATSRERRLLRVAEDDKRKLTAVLAKLEELEARKSIVEKKIGLINELKSQREIAVRIMDVLSTTLPDWVWLTEVNYENQLLKLKGRAISNTMIAEYIAKLEQSGLFGAVNLVEIAQKTQRNEAFLEFSLTAAYGVPAAPAPAKPPSPAPRRST
ncbi:MAG: PilN domain-containing protein [Candidatus Aminicenantes bacterium]|nr:PilN domain-containing protein [Candidatus Aminicenantes bacterium]